MLQNGYILKLYKKIANALTGEIITDSAFMTWMNFDCMDVFPVNEFHDFNRSINFPELKRREKYGSRQKMFLYSLDCNKDLLQSSGAWSGFPLITLTVLDFGTSLSDKRMECRNRLQEFIDSLQKADNIQGDVLGSLSMYDHILVLRGRSYKDMDCILGECRRSLARKGISVGKTYTIAGIDLRYVDAWQEEDLKVSVQLSCTSSVMLQKLRNSKKMAEIFSEHQVYSVLGKYDLDIVGTVRNVKEFVGLFQADGLLSADSQNVLETNTRFLNRRNIGNWESAAQDNVFGNEAYEKKLEEFIARYSRLDRLSPGIRESLIRLILREFQASVTVNCPEIVDSQKRILEHFLRFLEIHQSETERQEEFSRMINTLNLFLDNRVSVGMSDFETPYNVLRYSGSSLKVLLAYSGLVDQLMEILKIYKEMSGQQLNYVALVTADTGAKITATVYLSYCQEYRFININIPMDLIFEMRYVVPWLTHEVGHFIRSGWSRSQRNAAYYKSISRAVLKMLKPYMGTEVVSFPGREERQLVAKNQGEDPDVGEKFDFYRKNVCQFFEAVIYRQTFNYDNNISIPYNMARDLYSRTEEIAGIMQRVYEESIADIFMIKILGIDNLEEYLQIQRAYYNHINVAVQDLKMENISRILVVSAVIAGLDPGDYNAMRRYFFQLSDRVEKELRPLAGQLQSYNRYYLLEPLISFLDKQVGNGLVELIKTDRVSGICRKLRENYALLRGGDFKSCLCFLNGCMQEDKL